MVDEMVDPGVAATKLAWWQSEVAQSFAGHATHPVMLALMPYTVPYGIEARHLQAVIEGCQMDLNQSRYLDYPGLQRYCHLVAGVVGEVSAGIFGQTDPTTTTYANAGFTQVQSANLSDINARVNTATSIDTTTALLGVLRAIDLDRRAVRLDRESARAAAVRLRHHLDEPIALPRRRC